MAMTGYRRAPVAKRIAVAREKTGLQPAAVAEAVGLSDRSYDDLESYDDEAFMCISLGQLCALGRILGVSPRTLVTPEGTQETFGDITPTEVVEAIQKRLRDASVSVEDFGTDVGWDVASVVIDPEAIWSDWNLDGLQDICAAIGMNWLQVIPVAETGKTHEP